MGLVRISLFFGVLTFESIVVNFNFLSSSASNGFLDCQIILFDKTFLVSCDGLGWWNFLPDIFAFVDCRCVCIAEISENQILSFRVQIKTLASGGVVA